MDVLPPSARGAALRILMRWTQLGDPPMIPDRESRDWEGLTPRDRGFAFELISGVLRWRLMLDAVLASRLKCSLETLEPRVRAILWMGAYQLLLLSGVRPYAAVDSSVTLARQSGAGRAAGLVNAVLRNVTRLKGVVEVRHGLGASIFPRDFTTQIRFAEAVFPDPSKHHIEHLATITSHPPALVRALIDAHTEEVATCVLIRNNQRPVVVVRSDQEGFVPPAESGLVRHETVRGYWVARDGWNGVIEGLVLAGTVSPQDTTAGKMVRRALDFAGAPARVLDLCAGLGTKTVQLAQALPKAAIVGADIDAGKLARLMQRAKRMGLARVSTRLANEAAEAEEKFDLVLVDAPCSNTGVMGRRAQSRWRWPTLDLPALLALQTSLLERGLDRLAPGGILTYATCAIDPRENAALVAAFRQRHGNVALLAEETTLPSFSDAVTEVRDGGYYAVLRA